jgi:RimJ/RimL family protein N-acetyltransferase
MCVDRPIKFMPLDNAPLPLRRDLSSIDSGGLVLKPSGAFQSSAGPLGYSFDIVAAEGAVGTITLIVEPTSAKVDRIGHIGCEVFEGSRGQDLPARATRALFQLARDHGLKELLITCDVGSKAIYQACADLGAQPLDTLPPAPGDARKLARFVVPL